MRGYQAPDSEEDLDADEFDMEVSEKLMERFPRRVTCRKCDRSFRVATLDHLFWMDEFSGARVYCPYCGDNVCALSDWHSRAGYLGDAIKEVLPKRAYSADMFVWPIRNWFRRRTNFYAYEDERATT